jgi:hypothetical protein
MNKGASKAETAVAGLERVERRGRGRPPVETWQPELVREIDMRIAADGTWYYLGTPIARPAMVALFASILRREGDGRIALVTPVEKCLITVDDAPFVATAMTVSGSGTGQVLRFETNVGDVVEVDAAHPLRFVFAGDGHRPYVTVHEGLEALVTRAVAYDIMELCGEGEVDGESWYGVWSGGHFWPVMRASEVGDAG